MLSPHNANEVLNVVRDEALRSRPNDKGRLLRKTIVPLLGTGGRRSCLWQLLRRVD